MRQRAQHGARAGATLVLALGVMVGCGDDDTSSSPDASSDVDAGLAMDAAVDLDAATDTGAGPTTDATIDPDERARLGGLVAEIASGVCGALERCCDSASRAAYFSGSGIAESTLLSAELRARIADGVTDDECVEVVSAVFETRPFGPWVQAALAGYVALDAAGLDACLTELSNAECGEEVAVALADDNCFAYSKRRNGENQRRMFRRSSREGDACIRLNDGSNGLFYGTCDPFEASCCVMGEGRCVIGSPEVGSCRRVGALGEPCDELRGFMCVTGLRCSAEGSICEVPAEDRDLPPAALGEACAEGFSLTADCVDSWCDLLGTRVCEPLVALGEACQPATAEACGPGALCIENVCSEPPPYCTGPDA